MSDPLAQARRDLVRAKLDIEHFGIREGAYAASGPLLVAWEQEDGVSSLKAKLVKDPPIEMGEVVKCECVPWCEPRAT